MSRQRQRRRVVALCALLSALGCRPRPPEARLPIETEAGAEQVIVNYAPQRLRVFPNVQAQSASTEPVPGYAVIGSERPGLSAHFRPLGVTTQHPPAGYLARAGSLAWVNGHVVSVADRGEGAAAGAAPGLIVYDRDAKPATRQEITLPSSCQVDPSTLLQSDGTKLYALISCASPLQVELRVLDDQAQILSTRPLAGASPADLYLHERDADYVLAERQVLRYTQDPKMLPAIGAVPRSWGGRESRDLLRVGPLLLVVDGTAGLVIALDAVTMRRRFEKSFAASKQVLSVRAAMAGANRLIILTTEKTAQGRELYGTVLSLDASTTSGESPRLWFGQALWPDSSNATARWTEPELVPVAESDGGGALLIFSHRGNTGPLVALRRLTL